MLLTTGAFATDQYIGSASEYYWSPLSLITALEANPDSSVRPYDHGDNTVKNLRRTWHDQRIVQTLPAGSDSGHMMPAMHDHGDNVDKNYNAHGHK